MSDQKMGSYGRKRTNGKGSYISSTHGPSWLKATEDRLEKRRLACSKCGLVREGGRCPEPCNYKSDFGGW